MTSCSTLLLLLTLLNVSVLVIPTDFHASGRFQCTRHNEYWCFIIALQEVDMFSYLHDKIDVLGVHCTHKWRYEFDLAGKQEHDGLWDNFYEVAFQLRHNCTPDHSIREVFTNYEEWPVNSTNVELRWVYDLTHRGQEVDSWRPNNF